jgi:hypothetical protein
MFTSVDFSRFLLFNMDTGDKRRHLWNTLESSLTSDPRKTAFAFACLTNTSTFSIREVFVLMGSQYACRFFQPTLSCSYSFSA